ncbi:MAG TPA: tyrosine-protein phosphatase [Actinocatenispora sp.]
MDQGRCVPFSAVFNFRDLGGYEAAGGSRVRSGVVYRSDGLFRLTEADLGRFTGLRVRSVIDLRRVDEIGKDGRVPAVEGLAYHNVCLQTTAWTAVDVQPAAMGEFLAARYGEIADEAVTGSMAAVLRLIADDAAGGGTVFHCTAGKDRTGVVAAVVLALLGVPDETIAEDYAASQASEEQYFAWRARQRPDEPPVIGNGNAAPAEAILTFLAALRMRYGSVAGYVERAGLDRAGRAALRARLLVNA